MNTTPKPAVPTEGDADATPPEQKIAPLATAALDLVQAWAKLLDRELALARRSLRWCLIGIIALPVAALGVWLSLSALLVATAYVYSDSWFVALLFGAGAQTLMLGLLLRQLHHWARNLGLPQSRAALVRIMERIT